jgi:hypothetical protein
MKLKAMSNFQSIGLDLNELKSLTDAAMSTDSKGIDFVSSSLRSGSEIVKSSSFHYEKVKDSKDLYKLRLRSGGHVTMKYRDQRFRLHYNNMRVVLNPRNLDLLTNMLETRPISSVEEAILLRKIGNIMKGGVYQQNTSVKSINGYTSTLELAVRVFIKDILNDRNGISYSTFGSYGGIVSFINDFMIEHQGGVENNEATQSSFGVYISTILEKCGGVVSKVMKLPRDTLTSGFAKYVESRYPHYSGFTFQD